MKEIYYNTTQLNLLLYLTQTPSNLTLLQNLLSKKEKKSKVTLNVTPGDNKCNKIIIKCNFIISRDIIQKEKKEKKEEDSFDLKNYSPKRIDL